MEIPLQIVLRIKSWNQIFLRSDGLAFSILEIWG